MSDETTAPDGQAAPEETAPEVQPEPVAEAPEAEAPPDASPAFARVRYTPPPSTHTPVVSVGGVLYTMEQLTQTPTLAGNPGIRWWHGGTVQDIPTVEADALATLPGFSVVGPGTAPGGRTP